MIQINLGGQQTTLALVDTLLKMISNASNQTQKSSKSLFGLESLDMSESKLDDLVSLKLIEGILKDSSLRSINLSGNSALGQLFADKLKQIIENYRGIFVLEQVDLSHTSIPYAT